MKNELVLTPFTGSENSMVMVSLGWSSMLGSGVMRPTTGGSLSKETPSCPGQVSVVPFRWQNLSPRVSHVYPSGHAPSWMHEKPQIGIGTS